MLGDQSSEDCTDVCCYVLTVWWIEPDDVPFPVPPLSLDLVVHFLVADLLRKPAFIESSVVCLRHLIERFLIRRDAGNALSNCVGQVL